MQELLTDLISGAEELPGQEKILAKCVTRVQDLEKEHSLAIGVQTATESKLQELKAAAEPCEESVAAVAKELAEQQVAVDQKQSEITKAKDQLRSRVEVRIRGVLAREDTAPSTTHTPQYLGYFELGSIRR